MSTRQQQRRQRRLVRHKRTQHVPERYAKRRISRRILQHTQQLIHCIFHLLGRAEMTGQAQRSHVGRTDHVCEEMGGGRSQRGRHRRSDVRKYHAGEGFAASRCRTNEKCREHMGRVGPRDEETRRLETQGHELLQHMSILGVAGTVQRIDTCVADTERMEHRRKRRRRGVVAQDVLDSQVQRLHSQHGSRRVLGCERCKKARIAQDGRKQTKALETHMHPSRRVVCVMPLLVVVPDVVAGPANGTSKNRGLHLYKGGRIDKLCGLDVFEESI